MERSWEAGVLPRSLGPQGPLHGAPGTLRLGPARCSARGLVGAAHMVWARDLAADLLLQIHSQGGRVRDALVRLRSHTRDPRERALLTELSYGTLRQQGALDVVAAAFSRRLETLDALRAWRCGWVSTSCSTSTVLAPPAVDRPWAGRAPKAGPPRASSTACCARPCAGSWASQRARRTRAATCRARTAARCASATRSSPTRGWPSPPTSARATPCPAGLWSAGSRVGAPNARSRCCVLSRCAPP
jgi:hypothetical protein